MSNILEVRYEIQVLFHNRSLKYRSRYESEISDDLTEHHAWYVIRNWWYMPGEPSLRKFCADVHELAGKGKRVVDFVLYKARQLNFTNPKYVSRDIDVLEYSVETEKKPKRTTTTESWKPKSGGKRWYITQAFGPECVFYLKPLDAENTEFVLQNEVCGIDITPFTTPKIEDLLKNVASFEGGEGMNEAERALGTPSDLYD